MQPADTAAQSVQTDRLAQLTRQVRQVLGEDLMVAAWRDGVDFWADLALRGETVVGVLRNPKHEVLETSYEGVVTFADVMEKEVEVLRLLRDNGVPAPEVMNWRRRQDDSEISWMLCEFVSHEPVEALTEAQQEELGRITRRIHDIRPAVSVIEHPASWKDFMLARVGGRLASARRYYAKLPMNEILSGAGPRLEARQSAASSLLHMDLRPTNLCVAEGQIVAVIDVANAILGDPWLELGRIRSYGQLTKPFQRGYGFTEDHDCQAQWLLDFYELETAALLMSVAIEEIDDSALFETSRARAIELARNLTA